MLKVDQKRAFNKLKHDLEPWRNIIVQLYSIITWEKNFYPAIISGGISVIFLILWALDLSVITMCALVGLMAIVFDYIYPSISRYFFNPENWNGQQEEKFEQVCNQICSIRTTLSAWYEYIFTAKERKSIMFVIVTSSILLTFAWIGTVFNNLLLMYIVILGLTMYPGIQERSFINTVKEKFGCAVSSQINNLREKTKKIE